MFHFLFLLIQVPVPPTTTSPPTSKGKCFVDEIVIAANIEGCFKSYFISVIPVNLRRTATKKFPVVWSNICYIYVHVSKNGPQQFWHFRLRHKGKLGVVEVVLNLCNNLSVV